QSAFWHGSILVADKQLKGGAAIACFFGVNVARRCRWGAFCCWETGNGACAGMTSTLINYISNRRAKVK
ncbi:hypothetical protein FRX31_032599, partial [Thalictrum thalictroides]